MRVLDVEKEDCAGCGRKNDLRFRRQRTSCALRRSRSLLKVDWDWSMVVVVVVVACLLCLCAPFVLPTISILILRDPLVAPPPLAALLTTRARWKDFFAREFVVLIHSGYTIRRSTVRHS